MTMIATKKLLFLLADDQDRCYYREGGSTKKTTAPNWVKRSPNGWKDMTLQWATNQKYFSTIRAFTTAIKFVEDGADIINDRMIAGRGVEEVMYLIILVRDPSMGLNGYRLEVKMRLDFSKWVPDPRTGTSMNTLQDDVFALVTANESASYSIPCNSSNPAAIKVLYDGILLQDKFNYSIIAAPITETDGGVKYFAIPMVFINNEGDNAGTIRNDVTYENFPNPVTYVTYPTNQNFPLSFEEDTEVTIKGSMSFKGIPAHPFPANLEIFFMTSGDSFPVPARQVVFTLTEIDVNQTYTFTINLKITLLAHQKLFFLCSFIAFSITPISTNLSFIFSTSNEPTVNYGIRPLDLGKALVSQITNGKYTMDSKYLTNNNRKVFISGSSLRSFPDAVIQISWQDYYKALFVPYNLGVTVRKGVLFLEPLEDIYNAGEELLNLGDISAVTLTVAQEYIYTSAKVGYVKQTYNQRNGRYETNCIHNYKFPINTVLNVLDLVSPIRADPFGQEFIRTGYPNLDSTDDKGDADVFTVMVSDTVGTTEGVVSTAVAVTIETLILASPVLKTPFTNSTVYNQNPTISGLAQPFKTITLFADGVIDGTTVSDANGNFSYQIQTSLESLSANFNGVHVIEANAQTDPSNISGFSNALTLIINTMIQSSFLITSPTNNDTLYNNLPLITGIAPSGRVITLSLDGTPIATLVTNSSGLWAFQITAAIADGLHVVSATAPGLPDAPALKITVNKNVSSPLITSLAYGDILYNNLPLIKGVAIPGTVVPVYLDGGGGAIVGGIAGPMGTATADANGDWSFQVVTVTDSSGNVTAYIPDGLHIVATTATPVNVLAAITGYRLMRGSNKGPVMDYDVIRLDDQFIPPGVNPATLPPTLGQFLHPETLFNIEETTPLRCLRAHDNTLASFLFNQPGELIKFTGAEVNPNMVTQKNGVVFNEGASVNNRDLAPALFYYWYLNFKAKVPFSFNEIMTSLENDGYISLAFNNIPIKCLPIGTMSMKIATNEAQTWKLLISTKTPLSSLLQLFAKGITINIGKNMIHISDYNPLHFVKYNYTPPAGFHFTDIYDDWQKNRFPRWQLYRPDYAQPFEKGDPLPLQVITNGVGSCEAHLISILTGLVVEVFPFAPVVSIVSLPNILQEVLIDLTPYDEGQYWFAIICDGVIVGISEKIWLKEDWPDTYGLDYGGSEDQVDYYFSTGIRPRIRVQAEFLVWEQDSEVDIYEDEEGDNEITRGLPTQSRFLQFGNEKSLISDWMSKKLNTVTLLKNLYIENYHYTRNTNSKWEPQDLGKGIPEMLVKISVSLAENQGGVTFATPGDSSIDSITWSLDNRAFGRQSGVTTVTTTNE